MSDRSDRVKAIFLEALEGHTPDQWPTFLERACTGDAELRAEVEKLLRARSELGSFHEPPRLAQPPTVDDPVTERPGVVIGPYKLIQEVGEGGMGSVWMAQQTEPVKRLVALKVIKPGMDSRQVIVRFEAERQALALMDHPNIARVFDAGTTSAGRPYFVMELVKGVPLTKYCDERRLTPRERLELFIPVCQAIQHAHQKGIIHRDIKPTNVLVALYDGKPVPKVIDFGVAKATGQQLTDHTLVTGFGAVVGTLQYMSPEQAELNQLDIDTRSDIYSLGVLLYELLTGSTPLEKKRLKEAAMLEVLRLIREEEPPKPSTRLSTADAMPSVAANRGLEPKKLSGQVRGELDWIVMKALAKERERRYETANGFAADVRRYLADEPVWACPPSVLYRFRKFARRNKMLLTAATLIAVTVLVAGATVLWKWWEAESAREQERIAKNRAIQGEAQAVAAERESRRNQADALVGQARGTRLSRLPGQRFEALALLKKAASIGRELKQPPQWYDRLRNEAIAALALPDIHLTQEFGHVPSGAAGVGMSDDFELYVQTTEKGNCTVHRTADDSLVTRLPHKGGDILADFGPRRTLAVFGPHRSFQLWDLNRKEPAILFVDKNVATWTFHPDGKILALLHDTGSISIYHLATGKLSHRFPTSDTWGANLRFHPSEPLLACFRYRSNLVRILDWKTGAVATSVEPGWGGGNGYGDWNPDGRTLLVSQADGEQIKEFAFDPATRKLSVLRTLASPYQGDAGVTFNEAGDRFVTRGWSGTIHLFDAISGRLLFKTPGTIQWDYRNTLKFDRTGQRLGVERLGPQANRAGVWSFAPCHEYRSLDLSGTAERADHLHLRGPVIHPNGRLAAVGRMNGLSLVDVETGREVAFLSLPDNYTIVRFDGTGNLLANGSRGFYRWPVRSDPLDPGRLTVGPVEVLPFYKGRYPIAASHDGRVISQSMWSGFGMQAYAGGWIQHPNSPTPRRVASGAMGATSVSPDGRLVAFASGGVSIYNAASGERIWRSLGSQNETCLFSPDGRWLLTTEDGGRSYAVDTWKPGPQLGPGLPCDATSHLALLSQKNGTFRIVELATGRELARLEDPDQNHGLAAISPDGAWVVSEGRLGARIWDLRRIREGLVELGLDWDAPAIPKALDPGTRPALEVKVDQENLDIYLKAATVVHNLRVKGDHAGAIAAIQKALTAAPEDPELNNALAWMLVIAADPKVRDAKRAVALAQKAIKGWPNRWEPWRTLGLAHHFDGNNQKAVEALKKSLAFRRSGDVSDYFPLAAAHQQLGNKKEAREWYDRGVAWARANKALFPSEIAVLRADAETALGIEKQAKPYLLKPPAEK